jgi:DNA repair exonuclease SbcCD ATPase subunit
MNEIQILHKNYNGPVKRIIHISDIHIRQGDLERSRYSEYKHVFNGFTQDISKLIQKKSNNDTIIVITGDVFHNKGKMDTPAIKLFFRWMDKMLNIAPVFMICGNHDFRQEDPHHPDMIEVLTVPYISEDTEDNSKKTTNEKPRVKYPLFYLKETGRYIWQNIGFGLVSVKDTLRVFNTAGILSKLPNFPSPFDFPESVNHKIALFHGTLLPYGTDELKNIHGYRLEWFRGYDAVLLGDNHVQQVHRSQMKITIDSSETEQEIVWGYPGSLIQQNFGETPFGHGYIMWDLNNETSEINTSTKHILNNYGMITVKKNKNTDDYNVFMSKKDICDIKDAINRDMFPKYPKIRIIGKTGEDTIVKTLFEKGGIKPESLMVTIPIDEKEADIIYDEDMNHNGVQGNIQFSIDQMVDINHTEKWIEFLKKSDDNNTDNKDHADDLIYIFIKHPNSMRIDFENIDTLPKEIIQKIKVRNTKIDKALEEYKDLRMQHHGENHKIILKHMAWDYVMCYGPGNYFDFETLENKVCLLNGRNAIGKSAFLDVLCIGLYGEPSKQRNMTTGKKMTGKMIHDHRPPNVSMSVSIMFTLNDEIYEVFRSFSQQAKEENWARPISSTICSVKINDTAESIKTIVCEGTLMVDEWIIKRFGTIDDILMSTFVSQIETNNFFHLKQDEQKAILDKALHLESIASYATLLKEAILAHNDIATMITNSKSTLEDLIQSRRANVKEPASIQDKISKYTIKLNELNNSYQKLVILVGNSDDLDGNVENDSEIKRDPATLKKQLERDTKKLLSLGSITDEDKKHALMIQGEQKATFMALRQEKADIGEPTMEDISLQKIQSMIDTLNKNISKLEEMKPERNLSQDILKKQLADLQKWTSEQRTEWLENPDDLETFLNEHLELQKKLEEKYTACVQNPAQRPVVGTGNPITKDIIANGKKFIATQKKWTQKDLIRLKDEYNDLRTKWTDLMKVVRVQPRSLDLFKAWKTEYNTWCERVSSVRDLEENVEDLRRRYNDYGGYLRTIEGKLDTQTMYTQGIEQISSELDELSIEKLPFNPECWACKSLPTRTRHQELCNKKDILVRDLQKNVKYFKKIPTFDLEKERATLEELRILLDTREYYEKTVERMIREENEWVQIHTEWEEWKTAHKNEESLNKQIAEYEVNIQALEEHLWELWQVKESTLKKNCEEIRKDIDAAKQFMKEYEDYVVRQRFLEEETDRHSKYEKWELEHSTLIEKQSAYDLELRRKLLDEKFTQWQSENNMRVDLVDKIKTYESLEKDIQRGQRMLNYIEMKRVYDEREIVEKKLKEYSDNTVRYQKELEDIQKISENMKTYQECYTMLSDRRDALILLENRFIGDKNGDEGYKEWVYKQHVIPLIEKEINRFLSLIDTIRLKITYTNKSFQYMVIDRGNTPTLAMSSGYQRFIIGISLRLAFACIGATGQNIRHLFIDEGFVACDAFNLEKVQSMLRKMMEYGGYVSIILMSHLEAIRDAADLSIDIHREGLFSNVRWGTSYPRLTKITPGVNEIKKKGRPKKST